MLFKTPINLDLKDGEAVYFPGFFNQNDSNHYFTSLLHHINWKQDDITVFGKTYLQPRLTAFLQIILSLIDTVISLCIQIHSMENC